MSATLTPREAREAATALRHAWKDVFQREDRGIPIRTAAEKIEAAARAGGATAVQLTDEEARMTCEALRHVASSVFDDDSDERHLLRGIARKFGG